MTIQDLRKNFMSERGVIVVSIVLLALALFESTLAPWAPYFFLFAVLALAIPLALKSSRYGKFKEVFSRHWKLILLIWAVSILIDQATSGAIAKVILSGMGVFRNPEYSLPAFTEVLLSGAASRMRIPPMAATIIFAFIAVIWAPIGEELFYRGYVFGMLRERRGFLASALVSSLFFGLRHVLPVFFLFPRLYWISALSWGVFAFVFGMLNNLLYEKTGSLYPCMIGHALLNLASLAFM
jgi:membrane protease YdiL (CAAX protease family)